MRYVPSGGRHLPLTCGSASVRHIRAPGASEGFFGTLKSDFFDHRYWTGVTFEEFERALDGHIERYRCKKLKKSLGWKTIRQHRIDLGYAA